MQVSTNLSLRDLTRTCSGFEKLQFFKFSSKIQNSRIRSVDRIALKLLKGTSTHQLPSFEHITKYVRLSVQKLNPVQTGDDGQTDGHPNSICDRPFWLAPNNKSNLIITSNK